MKIETSWISKSKNEQRSGYYEDCINFDSLPKEKIKAICAFCHYNNKFLLVKNGEHWEPVAGHVEQGELPEETLFREIKEESNMKVLKYFPLGYLYIKEVDIFQAQYFCTVEPYGQFTSDPDGGVTAIRLVNFNEINELLTKDDTSKLTLKRCQEVFNKLTLLSEI